MLYWNYLTLRFSFSGVVQRSCIGTLLFLIYVKDVSQVFSDGCICKLYADDIKLYSAMKTVNDCKNLQESLDVLYNWSCAWQLSISYNSGFQTGVRGPKGVRDGFPRGPREDSEK